MFGFACKCCNSVSRAARNSTLTDARVSGRNSRGTTRKLGFALRGDSVDYELRFEPRKLEFEARLVRRDVARQNRVFASKFASYGP